MTITTQEKVSVFIPSGPNAKHDKMQALKKTLNQRNAYDANSPLSLKMTDDGLGLLCLAHSSRPFVLDYTSGSIAYRLKHASVRKEGLARAVGQALTGLRCLDVTGGYGHDSLLLAALGAQVTYLERNPVMAALVNDAVIRGSAVAAWASVFMKVSVLNIEAVNYIDSLNKSDQTNAYPFDLCVCDPMFPHKAKDALPKLDMQLLQHLELPPSLEEETELLNACLKAARRCIVKRPKLAPYLASSKPHHSLSLETVRFDIYLAPTR